MIQALIFDFDGLIIDTESPIVEAWQEVYQEYNVVFPLQLFLNVIGTYSHFDPFTYLATSTTLPLDENAVRHDARQRIINHIAQQPLLPGVIPYIEEAKSLGLKLAVASSSPHRWVDSYLQERQIFSFFDTVKCLDDVQKAKPAPDLYLAALDALHLQGHQAIALEDSSHGVQAARQAGIFCVAVPNPTTVHLSFSHASLQLHSLLDLPLSRLLALASGPKKGNDLP